MNKTITLNHITLAGCCLLFASAQALAEPPVTDDQLEMIEPEEIIEPEVEEISTSDDVLPLMESLPATEAEPSLDLEEVYVETNEIPEELEVIDSAPMDTKTSTEVTEHSTETVTTGDVMEMRADETLPVRVLNFPRRGMSMEKVKNELGDPVEISETIGKPPITSWSYNDRTVYFEYSRVVHVVDTH